VSTGRTGKKSGLGWGGGTHQVWGRAAGTGMMGG
jgi:hypothetical protein